MDSKTGNSRAFNLTNHRVDKDAMLEVISTPQQTQVTANAGFGHGETNDDDDFINIGGVASALEVTYTLTADPDGICIMNLPSPAVFFISGKDANNRPIAKFVNYEPGSPAQGTQAIPLTEWRDVLADLWIQRNQVLVDLNNQVRWDAAEVFDTTEVRFMEYLDFKVTEPGGDADTADPANGWARWAKITDWPTVWPNNPVIAVFDPTDAANFSDYGSSMVWPIPDVAPVAGYPLGVQDERGIYRLLKALQAAALMQYDSSWEISGDGVTLTVGDLAGWFRRPVLGHKQLDNKLVATKQPIGGFRISYTGSVYAIQSLWAVSGLTITLDSDISPRIRFVCTAGRVVQQVHMTPYANSVSPSAVGVWSLFISNADNSYKALPATDGYMLFNRLKHDGDPFPASEFNVEVTFFGE